MAHNFTTYRILCSTPPDLEAEQDVYNAAIAEFGEQVAIPAKVLFATASFRRDFDVKRGKHAVESNIRMCDFFVQIFGEAVPDQEYIGFVEYAIQSGGDAAWPMHRPTVLFKDAGGLPPELNELRSHLSERCDVASFQDVNELAKQLRKVFEGWYAQVRPD